MSESLVIGYRHTGIIVKNIEESIHFYRDLLGLKEIQDFFDDSENINKITGIKNANVHMIKLKAEDGTVLEILEYKNHPTEIIEQPIYNVGACHIAFQVNNVDVAYKKLVENGITVVSKPVLSNEKIAKVFLCLDPNKIRVELVEMVGTNPWD